MSTDLHAPNPELLRAVAQEAQRYDPADVEYAGHRWPLLSIEEGQRELAKSRATAAVLAPLIAPGSSAAAHAGCTCAVAANRNGRGFGMDAEHATEYWMRLDCPLHGAMAQAAIREQEERRAP